MIIIGSLAAGYHFFADDPRKAVRTKDVDCMFSPHAQAVAAAREVTEELLRAQWTPQPGTAWSAPGKPGQPPEDLPLVRLRPPASAQQSEWFIELLGAPDESIEPAAGRRFETIETSRGHFALCSFGFLALAEWQPTQTDLGLRIARPEMMALANLLHHPAVGQEVMSGHQFGRPIKRSNKDLGRVLALAHLTTVRDRANSTEDFEAWPHNMAQALAEKFPRHAADLAARAGNGVRELLASEADLDQALRTCNLGLLASFDIGIAALRATGQRLIAEVIEPLADHHAPSSAQDPQLAVTHPLWLTSLP